MTESKVVCCSSPAAMCYWFAASLIAWGALSLIGIYWRPLHGLSAATILFAMAIGCAANWLKNRTLHCAITAPLFLIAAVVFLLSDASMVHVNSILVWPFVPIGVGVAFLVEWRCVRVVRQSS
jgi:hypothetical protein